MIRTLDRYVAGEFARLFLLFVISTPMLFVLGDWTDRIDNYTEQGIPLKNVALGYLYQMPLFISWSLPVAALIATVFTVNNMTRHSEMSAAKAGGISFFRMLAVLPVLGILLTALGLVLTELVPIGIGRKMVVMGEVEATRSDMRHDFIYTGADGHVYTIRALTMSGPSLRSITIEHPGSATSAPRYITAGEAHYDSLGHWVLQDGVFRTLEPDLGVESAFMFERMIVAGFTETPEQLMARPKAPEELRYAEMDALIETLERSGGRPLELIVEQAQKIAIPMATLVIVLFGAPLANSSGRGGTAYGIGVSLGITILYLMLFKLTGAMGIAGLMDPVLAAWIPNAIFVIAAGVLLLRVRT
ncbi:MAG: LptF/LptG family permease [Gemmatimonadota bacterium]